MRELVESAKHIQAGETRRVAMITRAFTIKDNVVQI